MDSLQIALQFYRAGRIEDAEAVCERLRASTRDRQGALALLAELRMGMGRTEAAIADLTELARLAPRDAANLRRLGGALMTIGRREAAIEVLLRAVHTEPANVRGHNNLGQAQLQLRRLPQALASFTRALELDPGYPIARFNLALTLEALNRHTDALREYDACVALHPAHQVGWAQRGALQWRLGRCADALKSLDTAIALRTDDRISLTLRAATLLALERAPEALAAADAALAHDPNSIEGLQYRAAALAQLQRLDEARTCLERALQLAPQNVEVWCNLAVVHQRLGDSRDAQRCYAQALQHDPANLAARAGLLAATVSPVPATAEESAADRQAFTQALSAFECWLEERPLQDAEVWNLAQQPFFYLSYQEDSNKSLLQRYRVRASAALAARTAAPVPRIAHARGDRRFRLGIVSAHVFEHSVFRALTQGWLANMDRDRFETTVFHLGVREDAATALARRCADRFEGEPRSVQDWACTIGDAGLDALLYPEIGMDRGTLALASLRMAPRQFAAWGHPETSGMPTIDAFLSGEAFEPADAEAHYSERLIRLPRLGVYVEPPAAETTARDIEALGLRHDAPWFICPGTPYKYHPAHDAVWVRIAQRVPDSTLVFFEYERRALSERLRRRLEVAFAAAGLDPQRQLRWLPWQPRPEFRALLGQATGYLDTLGFSGFNTLLLALDAGLPCVTREGRFLRGRLGSGILRHAGLDELVAGDSGAYVDIAVRLGTDAAYRTEIAARVRAAATRAYADLDAVRAFERALLD
jgi:protein O-GlcNAc transferase